MSSRLAALGFAAYLIALVLTAPAGLLDSRFAGLSDGRLRLSEARGLLWSGSGRLDLRAANGRGLLSEELRWRLLPAHLLQGRLAFELQPEQGQSFVLTAGWRGLELASAEFALPATALVALQPKLAPLQLSGELTLNLKQLTIGRSGWSGNASLHWYHAGSALTQVSPLGDYELQMTGEGGSTQVTLLSRQGPLRLEGKGAMDAGGKLAFLASARIDPEFRAALEPLMRLIAVERGDGSFELQLG